MTRRAPEPTGANGRAAPARRNLDDAIATLHNCRYCLMCRHVDPLSHVTHDEALTPHGIALTIASEQRGLIGWSEEALGVVFSELDNDNARAHCVTDQPFSDAVARVKAHLVEADAMPDAVRRLRTQLEQHGSAFGNETLPAATRRGDVALFVTDEGHALRPGAVDAAERLLEACGASSVRVGRGRSSGLTASSLGLLDVARRHARELVDEIETTGATRVVVLGPGDRFALTSVLADRLETPLPAGVDVVELVEVVARAQAEGAVEFAPAAAPGAFAYVDPTYAVRAADRHDHPRALLGAVWAGAPIELFWRRERAHPMGNGAIRVLRPAVADALSKARAQDARSRGADVVVSDDPATLWQLDMHAESFGLRVQGLYELLADRLR